MRLFVSRKFPFNSGATLPLKLLSVMAYILSRLLLPMPGPAQEEPHAARFTTIDAPGAGTNAFQGTLPVSINHEGAVLGPYIDANSLRHAFVRDRNGAFVTFEAPGAGTVSPQGTVAIDINENDLIVGRYMDPNNVNHGFLRDKDGVFTTFDAPGAGTSPGQGQGTFSFNINDKSAVAGWYGDSGNVSHGFVRSKHGAITTFDAPGAALIAFEGTFALSINADGEIVGYYCDANMVTHGFLLRFEEEEHTVGRSDD
jgi:hypothetical protein